MINSAQDIFDEGVVRFFEPLAKRNNLSLQKVKSGIYELAGSQFVLHIRRGIGHSRDFLVTLAEKKSITKPVEELSGLGLGVILNFYGEKLGTHKLHTSEGYLIAFDEAAQAVDKYCVPYLLGHRSNYGEILEFSAQKIEASGLMRKKYHFPPKVREEWL